MGALMGLKAIRMRLLQSDRVLCCTSRDQCIRARIDINAQLTRALKVLLSPYLLETAQSASIMYERAFENRKGFKDCHYPSASLYRLEYFLCCRIRGAMEKRRTST
jgi:hypothetical protein